jgi:hypothetical protein
MPDKKWFRKRTMIIPVVVAVVSLTAAGVVAAQGMSAGNSPAPKTSKQCYSKPCYGNAGNEVIYERIGDRVSDNISSYYNDDRLHANTYSKDTDVVFGYSGNDYVYVDDGDTKDSANGGRGYDRCYVDATIEAANTCEKVITR